MGIRKEFVFNRIHAAKEQKRKREDVKFIPTFINKGVQKRKDAKL